jgi:ribose transport system ATP-binding protein
MLSSGPPGARLAARHLSKRFGELQALAGASLEIQAGEIHALIGRNGSGKSTLVKVLTGYHRPDAGEVVVDGAPVEPWKRSLHDTGIAVVHQDLGVFPELSVTENFAIGHGYRTRTGGTIDWKEEERLARAALAPFGIDEVAGDRLSSLPQVHAVIVAMARALDSAGSAAKAVLVLDEPTSFLPRRQAGVLFEAMRRAADAGMAILFITHRMGEVLEIADAVTALRDGRVVLSRATAGLGEGDLVAAMMGREEPAGPAAGHEAEPAAPRPERGPPAVSLRGVSGETLANVDLDAYPGEVLGVTGLLASGLDELTYILGGYTAPVSGTVEFAAGEPGTRGQDSVGVIPADRVRAGVLTGLTLEANMAISRLARSRSRRWLSKARESAIAADWIERLGVPRCSPSQPIESLSGGNQQKVILARWLSCRPRVLVAEGPTQGIDVRAKADVLRHLRDAARSGIAVIIVSYEAEEVVSVCDRVMVLRAGAVVADLRPDQVDTAEILEAVG